MRSLAWRVTETEERFRPRAAATSTVPTPPPRTATTAPSSGRWVERPVSAAHLAGLWWNFGDNIPFDNQRALLRHAFDRGITHFDLANNYGPPYGTAETNFGRMMREDFRPTATS
jgi:L-glyceraldehyde 3-phosphate reductase